MPVHDWTRVEDGIFHACHVAWVSALQKCLNSGLLPDGYYALAEQHAGRTIPDILTLHTGHSPQTEGVPVPSQPIPSGGTAVAEAQPKVRRHESAERDRRRSLAIRHVSGHRLIALVEIVPPANKDRPDSVAAFAKKVVAALDADVHVLVLDLFPPGNADPYGMHGAIRQYLRLFEEDFELSAEEPLTLASYSAGPTIEIFVEHTAVGAAIPDMPLFLTSERCINVPLESTYQDAYSGVPKVWRDVLEGRAATV